MTKNDATEFRNVGVQIEVIGDRMRLRVRRNVLGRELYQTAERHQRKIHLFLAERFLWSRDPRRWELPEDSYLWQALLRAAFDRDHLSPRGLHQALFRLRKNGCRLVQVGQLLRLRRGDMGQAVFLACCNALPPNENAAIRRLLLR